jgi:GTP-binding protein HflX
MEKLIPAILIGVNIEKGSYQKDIASLEELSLLAETAGFYAVHSMLHKRGRIDPGWYIGAGKARQVRSIVKEFKAEAVLFDFELTPVQLRNLEEVLKCRIMSRTELILNIFEQRARTREAKLQVELATLIYSLPRLRHMWPHLNRIEGGIGVRGPGEKQLEMDKRRLARRITKIKKDLISVRKHRMVMRKNREGKNRVALVGYTNAGKSSLLNTLAHSSLFTENRLFATLDPATREVWLGDGEKALVTDTVGFIKRLPHTLIASFRSTLEEVKEADILLHVVDIASDDAVERIAAVNEVLHEIAADHLPVLYVFNKVDLLDSRDMKGSLLSRYQNHVIVSAKTGEGIDLLRGRLLEFFREIAFQKNGVNRSESHSYMFA